MCIFPKALATVGILYSESFKRSNGIGRNQRVVLVDLSKNHLPGDFRIASTNESVEQPIIHCGLDLETLAEARRRHSQRPLPVRPHERCIDRIERVAVSPCFVQNRRRYEIFCLLLTFRRDNPSNILPCLGGNTHMLLYAGRTPRKRVKTYLTDPLWRKRFVGKTCCGQKVHFDRFCFTQRLAVSCERRSTPRARAAHPRRRRLSRTPPTPAPE